MGLHSEDAQFGAHQTVPQGLVLSQTMAQTCRNLGTSQGQLCGLDAHIVSEWGNRKGEFSQTHRKVGTSFGVSYQLLHRVWLCDVYSPFLRVGAAHI